VLFRSLVRADSSPRSDALGSKPLLSRSVSSSSPSALSSSNTSSESQSISDQAKIKRRTSLPPRKMEGGNMRPPKRQHSQPLEGIAKLSRAHSLAENISGVLDRSQLDAGYGMGMCVPTERRKAMFDGNSRPGSMPPPTGGSGTGAIGSSLFAAVTAVSGKRTEHVTPSRSFSGVLARSKSLTNVTGKCTSGGRSGLVTVTTQQFVFREESQVTSSYLAEGASEDQSFSGWGGEESRAEDSRSRQSVTKKRALSSETQNNGLKRLKTLTSTSDNLQKSSLYAKLTKSVGPIVSSTTLKSSDASDNSSQRFRPSQAMRSKLASYSHSSLVITK